MAHAALSRPYKGKSVITIVICFFLVLDCTALGINFFITQQVEDDALAINIAGRQRMLSQRMTKVLLLMSDDQMSSVTYKKELEYVYKLFLSTLVVFEEGGDAVGGLGNSKKFPGLSDPIALQFVSETRGLIEALGLHIERLLENPEDQVAFNSALEISKNSNLKMLGLMNALTFRIEQMAAEKTTSLRWVQAFAFVLALLNFAIIVRLYNKRSEETEMLMQSFMHLVNSAAACLIVFNEKGEVQFANAMSLEKFGYSKKDFLKLTETKLFRVENDETFAVTATGEAIKIELLKRSFVLNGKQFLITTINDISHHMEVQEHLSYLASHDLLTGLGNRRGLLDRLELEVARAERYEGKLGIFFIDLDKFKPVNDLFGHGVGDILLKKFSNRLKNAVRKSDFVARYGGDEFVVLMIDVKDDEAFESCRKAIGDVFQRPFDWEGEEIFLDCSVGVSTYPADSKDSYDLLLLADQRMYESKKNKRKGSSVSS
ncbi:diguanylate cyclase [Neptuniibacter sp. 2_MG-2023]|uniref:diguanylate cyclase n=1 Tax=Neptuniibacter sp. 2_MG-2023 TaxID=3062671 RepID=UPI0026E453DB|nr:diguanylate cyclase [Neptuniibacter sp. 2_MG-2023]MDO6513474.1 diguanylate cyclase [Neptuniibacter sp. 2_MG-2023]